MKNKKSFLKNTSNGRSVCQVEGGESGLLWFFNLKIKSSSIGRAENCRVCQIFHYFSFSCPTLHVYLDFRACPVCVGVGGIFVRHLGMYQYKFSDIEAQLQCALQ